MSRHLQILRKAQREGDLLEPRRKTPGSAPDAPPRALPGASGDRDQWQQLAHELFLRREAAGRGSVGVVSATAGEGSSFVAAHLAAELARSSERPTLLLEANVYRPAQADRHGAEPNPGLRRLLPDREFPVEQCLRQTAIEHLWLLPAGSASNGSGPAPAPDWTHFPQLFQALRGRFPGIVVDLPPVNLSTDTLIVSPLFDGLVMVVAADLCSREVIGNAVERLRRANSVLLGTVLNKRKFVIPEPIYRRL